MNARINTNVFYIIEGSGDLNAVNMSPEFTDLADVLQVVLNKWNEVQCRNTAVLASREHPAKYLKAMAETLITVCDRALENPIVGDDPFSYRVPTIE